MIRKNKYYWICQLLGWLFYSLLMIFFAFSFRREVDTLILKRLLLSISFGLLFTHLLRTYIHQLKLSLPTSKKQWLILLIGVLIICITYSFCNSWVVEYLGWYNAKVRATVQKRFLFNIFNDTPIIFIWVSIYYVWHYVVANQKNQVATIKMETLIKELELKTIKSHINPHFIFNALNSIRALVDENPTRARTAITELSNILRSSMLAEKIETSPLEKELNIVKDYLALEKIRFEERLQLEYEIDDETLDLPMPPMMLQTLAENAIKHGISQQTKGGTIKIISKIKNNQHILVIQNTGKLPTILNTNGFGIISTKNRLNYLYGNNASFELNETQNNMVQATILISLNYE